MSDLPKTSSLADGLEALSPPSSQTDGAPTATGQQANPHPWTVLPAPGSAGLFAARQTDPSPHGITALGWLPPEDLNVDRRFVQERWFPAAWQEANDGMMPRVEAELLHLTDSRGRSWRVLSGGPWASLDLLLQTWPTPPESVQADWKKQAAEWESLATSFPPQESNRLQEDNLRNHKNRIALEDSQRWWVDQQGVLLPFLDLWGLLSQIASSLQATSQSTEREKENSLAAKSSSQTPADPTLRKPQTAPSRQATAATFQSKLRSKTHSAGRSSPTSRTKSGNRNRATLLWVGAIAVGLLGLLISRTFHSDSTPVVTPSTQANQQPTEHPGATEFQPPLPSTSNPSQANAQLPADPLDLRGLSPTSETVPSQPSLELSSPNLFPEGDLKTKLDRLLGGSPGEPLANVPTTDILPEAPSGQIEGSSELRDADSADQVSADSDSIGVATGPDLPTSAALEDRSFPLENLPVRSKWILRDRGLDPLLSLVMELEQLEGWQWNRMPISLEAGRVVRAWGRHEDHPEAGGMVIQASLRTGRVWQIEVDVGWSPDPETPPVRLSIGQADQWLNEVQSGLLWHDQALQQLRQTRNLTSNSSQRSLMLDQIRTLEGQQRSLKDLESRWQKVATMSQIFYDQQAIHLRWQSSSTDAASTDELPESP